MKYSSDSPTGENLVQSTSKNFIQVGNICWQQISESHMPTPSPQFSQALSQIHKQYSLALFHHNYTSRLTLCQNLFQEGLFEETPSQPCFPPVNKGLQNKH